MQISATRVFISYVLCIVINSPNRSALRNRIVGALVRYAPVDVSLQGNAGPRKATVVRRAEPPGCMSTERLPAIKYPTSGGY